MRMNIFGFENELEFNDANINILEIHNSKLFRDIVNSISEMIEGRESKETIHLIDDKENSMNFAKSVQMIVDIFNYDYNLKTTLTKIYKDIESNIIQNQELCFELEEMCNNIINSVESELMDYDLDLKVKSKLEIMDIIKFLEIKINNDDFVDTTEKIYAIIDLMSILKDIKLLIFCNLKIYFDDKEIIEIYKYAKQKELKILLIEHKESIKNLKYEKKLVIDNDLFDIII